MAGEDGEAPGELAEGQGARGRGGQGRGRAMAAVRVVKEGQVDGGALTGQQVRSQPLGVFRQPRALVDGGADVVGDG